MTEETKTVETQTGDTEKKPESEGSNKDDLNKALHSEREAKKELKAELEKTQGDALKYQQIVNYYQQLGTNPHYRRYC